MFGQKREHGAIGAVDGGEGRDSRPPTGYQKVEPSDEEEVLIDDDPLADYGDFADPGDAEPGDRRRDPLRR